MIGGATSTISGGGGGEERGGELDKSYPLLPFVVGDVGSAAGIGGRATG